MFDNFNFTLFLFNYCRMGRRIFFPLCILNLFKVQILFMTFVLLMTFIYPNVKLYLKSSLHPYLIILKNLKTVNLKMI